MSCHGGVSSGALVACDDSDGSDGEEDFFAVDGKGRGAESEASTKNGGASLNYDIYRVFNAGDPARAFIAVLRDPFRMLQEQKIQLCLAV